MINIFDPCYNQITSVLEDLQNALDCYNNPTDVEEALTEAVDLIEYMYDLGKGAQNDKA